MWKEIIKTWVDWVKSTISTWGTDVLMETTHTKVAELVDILDKQVYLDTWEIKVIWSVVKAEAHESWEFHQAGHVWIYNSKWEILLQKRTQGKDVDSWLWDISAAWHIEMWESMEKWTLRELREELGEKWINKALKIHQPEHIYTYIEDIKRIIQWKDWHNNELNSVYILKYDWPIEELEKQEEEIESIKFIPLEQFEQEINDPEESKKYVLQWPEYYEKLFKELKKRLKK
ncbi:MAG: hypothetical protein ACD_71C00170G0007 [uncultured bacterium (gcode 4)]|uniref:Nudix hydrolase domain-containing protein n=1 Tax=uncultured bacterium (gcode 4) TaxID=1234023 RepID=K1ZIU4_9BACT|nr:MAG: hypothetical protein ACD_71C00170G0007 [uncultured bacterium (gcode 4)]